MAVGKLSGSLINSQPLPTELSNPTTTLTSSGQYLFLQAVAPLGYLTGTVRDATAAPFAGVQLSAGGATLTDRTGSDGRYLLALATGTTVVTALDTVRGDSATASATVASTGKTGLDLIVRMVPPRAIAVSPANGALNVQPSDLVTVTFSKKMEQGTVASTTFAVAGSDGVALPGKKEGSALESGQ